MKAAKQTCKACGKNNCYEEDECVKPWHSGSKTCINCGLHHVCNGDIQEAEDE